LIGESNFESDIRSDGTADLLSNPIGNAASRNSSGLSMADESANSVTRKQRHQGKLSRFAAAGGSADHHNLMLTYRVANFLLPEKDGELRIELGNRKRLSSLDSSRHRLPDGCRQRFETIVTWLIFRRRC
jgi:hypothetical protein